MVMVVEVASEGRSDLDGPGGVLRDRPHPARIEPQLAVRADRPPIPDHWWHERKLDGMRLLVHVDGDAIRLLTRNHLERSAGFPELTEALRGACPPDLVADGEVVAFEGERTSFSRLQGRMGLRDRFRAQATGIAVHLYLFDLLHLDGQDLRGLPLRERKRRLAEAVSFGDPLRFTEHRTGDPDAAWAEACAQGWEGLIAKDPDAPYRAGRSPVWRKLPCHAGQEFVVGGYTVPSGTRTGFGSLLLGTYEPAGLRYAGKVGTGFRDTDLQALGRVLARLEQDSSPFLDPPHDPAVRFVQPRLVVQVAFTEWTRDGRLRHPRYEGVRLDRDPRDVVREPSP